MKKTNRKKPTFIDLFSGCGGMSLGFERAGFQPVLAIDNWADALDTYKDIFDKCSIIVIEQQMSFNNAQNTMPLKLAQHLHS